MKRIIVLPLVFMLLLLMVGPVSAGPPVVETHQYDVDYPAFDHTLCPDIVVMDHEVYTQRFTYQFDKEGNLTKILLHFDGVDHLYNPDNPGVVLSGQFAGNAEIDPQTGELVRATGVPYHITAPGYGTVLVRAGRWTLQYPDGQVAGKNSEDDPKDIQQFCSILAGK